MMTFINGGIGAMKYNIIFGNQRKIDFFGTNEQHTENIEIEAANPKNKIITYKLNELALTKKFIEKSFLYQSLYEKNKKYNGIMYHYNHYPPLSKNFVGFAKQEMNDTINHLRYLGFDIDSNLKLSVNEYSSEIDKLNFLHFIFETEQPKLMTDNGNLSEELYLFEKINQLVHYLENIERSNNVNRQHLVVIRPANFTSRYKMQDEDYCDFSVVNSGDLVCDYATVGKDLYSCYCTNDMDLVRNNDVKQQEYLTDFVALHFRNYIDSDKNFERYKKWCEENKVSDYIDLTEPRYNPGRHILGHIENDIKDQNDFYHKIVKDTPQIIGTFFSDDKNNIIDKV